MNCLHQLSDGPLVCVRADDHERGHVYAASAGPDLSPDTKPGAQSHG